MHDVIALRVTLEDGSSRYFLTWGRLTDPVDSKAIEDLVGRSLSRFSLGGKPVSVTTCDSLGEASGARYFYESLFQMSQKLIPYGARYKKWAQEMLAELKKGNEIYYLGEDYVASTLGAGIINGPYFLVEGHDVSAHSSLGDVEARLEPYIKPGELRLFQSDGTELSLTTKGGPKTPVYKRPVVAGESIIGHDPSHLAEALRWCLANPPKRLRRRSGTAMMSAEALREAELPQLVEEFVKTFGAFGN